MNLIRVIRPNDTAIVSIIPEKESGKFRFVNFTKNHICSCQFDTFEDAVEDLKRKQKSGEVVSYRIIDCEENFQIESDGTLVIDFPIPIENVKRILLSNPETHIGSLYYAD